MLDWVNFQASKSANLSTPSLITIYCKLHSLGTSKYQICQVAIVWWCSLDLQEQPHSLVNRWEHCLFNVESSLPVTPWINPYSIGNNTTLKGTCTFICKFLFVVCNVRKSYLEHNTPNANLASVYDSPFFFLLSSKTCSLIKKLFCLATYFTVDSFHFSTS